MKRKLPHILLILMILVALMAEAQYAGFGAGYSPLYNKVYPSQLDTTGKLTFKPGATGYTVNMGSSFFSGYGGHQVLTTYVAPEFRYNVSKRFMVSGGVALINSTNLRNTPSAFYGPAPMRASVYATGTYLLSEKLTLSGTVYKDFNLYQPLVNDRGMRLPERQGMVLDLNYRPVRNLQFNAIIHIQEGGYDPWGYPSHPGFQGRPFYGNPW